MKYCPGVFRFGFVLLIFTIFVSAASGGTCPVLPDTTGFAAELTAFAQLDPEDRQARTKAAALLVDSWFNKFLVKDGEVKRGLYSALGYACYRRVAGDYNGGKAPNALGQAFRDLESAVVQDPTQLVARTALGMALVETGRPREGINHLEKTLCVLASTPCEAGTDDGVLHDYLREKALYFLALGYRDCGLWSKALAAVETCGQLNPTPMLNVLKGLCIAGSGRTSEAISFAVRMPPIEFRHRTALSSGWLQRPSDYANRWIKSQALLAAGDVSGARHVLGELKTHRARRLLPMYRRFWQDAGLVCELLEDPAARTHYNMVAWRSFLGWGYPSEDRMLAPVVLGYPSSRVPFFVTPDQGFEGGSPFAFIAAQLNIMAAVTSTSEADRAYLRGLDLCETLLRRNIQPDLVRAFRARVHLAGDRSELAHADLVFAQAGFASRGLVDPGTSILLGQQELLAGHNDRSRELFDEALAVVPENALAWRELGIALGRVRQFDLAHKAMDKALELEPDSLEGWFNLGVLTYRRGHYDQALLHFQAAWELEPGNERVQKMLQTVATAQRQAARTD